MTRNIEYLQYYLRCQSQNFKRNVASYTPTGSPEMNTADLNLLAIFCIQSESNKVKKKPTPAKVLCMVFTLDEI